MEPHYQSKKALTQDRELRNFSEWLCNRTIPLRVWASFGFASRSLRFLVGRRLRRFVSLSRKSLPDTTWNTRATLGPSRLPVFSQRRQKPNGLKAFEDIRFRLATKDADWHELINRTIKFDDEQDVHSAFRLKSLPLASIDFSLNHEDFELLGEWMLNTPHDAIFWHPYNVSERLVHLIWALSLNEHLLSGGLRNIVDAIYSQARYLRNNFEFALGQHNHVINNARALYTASVFFSGDQEAREWKNYSLKVFKERWPDQVLPDGVHSEQSVTYHFLLARTLWEMRELIKAESLDFPFDDDLRKMIAFAKVITRDDGSIPLIGHITPDWHWQELVGLLHIWGDNRIMPSSLAKLYSLYAKPTTQEEPASQATHVFPDAGIGVIRTKGVHMVLNCPPDGNIQVHGDQNYLGIDLWFERTHLIRDAGLTSYNRNQQRAWFESSNGQSAFTVDGLEPVASDWRRRQLPSVYWKSSGGIEAVGDRKIMAHHSGFCRLPDPVVVRRIVSESHGIVTIEDVMECAAAHTYSANFHFGSNSLHRVGSHSLVIFDAEHANKFEMTWSVELECEIRDVPFTISYGHQKIGKTAVCRCQFEGNFTIRYIIKRVS